MVLDSSSTANEVNQFFSILGSGSATQVANPTTPDDDQEYEKKQDVSRMFNDSKITVFK